MTRCEDGHGFFRGTALSGLRSAGLRGLCGRVMQWPDGRTVTVKLVAPVKEPNKLYFHIVGQVPKQKPMKLLLTRESGELLPGLIGQVINDYYPKNVLNLT